MEQDRKYKLLAMIRRGVKSGDSLTLSKHKALKATKSTNEHSIELTEDPEYQQIRIAYLTQHRHNRKWTK